MRILLLIALVVAAVPLRAQDAREIAEMEKKRADAAKKLKSTEAEERREGIRDLEKLKDNALPHVKDVAKLVNDPDVNVRMAAIDMLMKLGDSVEDDALPALLKLSKSFKTDDVPKELPSYCKSLVKIGVGSRKNIPILKELLKTGKLGVKYHVLKALTVADGNYQDLMLDVIDATDDGRAIGKNTICEIALDAYYEQTKKMLPEQRQANYGKALLQNFKKADPSLKRHFIPHLGQAQTGDESLVPTLKEMFLGDKDWIKRDVHLVIAPMGEKAMPLVKELEPMLENSEKGVRRATAKAICAVGPAAVLNIAAMTKKEDPATRLIAIETMGTFKANVREVLPPLIECFKDAEFANRKAAVKAIEALGEPALMAEDEIRNYLRSEDKLFVREIEMLLEKFAEYRRLK